MARLRLTRGGGFYETQGSGFYAQAATDVDGQRLAFEAFRGRVVLVVNVASL